MNFKEIKGTREYDLNLPAMTPKKFIKFLLIL